MRPIELSLSLDQLRAPQLQSAELDALLLEVIRRRSSLAVTLEPERLYLDATQAKAETDCGLRGRWCSPYLGGDLGEGCCMLTLPLVFTFEHLVLPSASLLPRRAARQSLADWLMHHLFVRLLQGQPIRLVSATGGNAQSSPVQQALTRAYLSLLSAKLRDPVLQRPNALELIRAAHHLPFMSFQSAILEQSAAWFRACAPQDLFGSELPLLKRQFLSERQWMMAQC